MNNKRMKTSNPSSTNLCPSSPREAQQVDYAQMKEKGLVSSTKEHQTENIPTTSTLSIDSKMSNIAKLKQQFVDEIKDIEQSMKETIKNLKVKISGTNKKADIIREKLKQVNIFLYNQSEAIYRKEQENKVLREKMEELYENQKEIFENMEDITNTLSVHENLSNQLANEYDHIILIQASNNNKLEEELHRINPDEKYSQELNQINFRINEQGRLNSCKKNEMHQIESDTKMLRKVKEDESREIENLKKKAKELEIRNESSKQKANRQKNDVLKEIEKIKQEDKIFSADLTKIDEAITQLNNHIETKRNVGQNILQQISEVNSEIKTLSEQNDQLENKRHKEDEENQIVLDQLKERLKISKAELVSIKQKEHQATNVLQKKNAELRARLKMYENVKTKLEIIEVNIKKEEECILQITKENENKTNDYDDKIKMNDGKLMDMKAKIDNMESEISKADEKIKFFEKEIQELYQKMDNHSEIMVSTNNLKISPTKKVIKYGLPDLFAKEELGSRENEKNRKKLYTPTLADDDLEIDSLTLEEQFTHLTQTKSSQSPEKGKKFFKHSTPSQSKSKKESTPRSRGRGRRN